jgi:hypothetical protein
LNPKEVFGALSPNKIFLRNLNHLFASPAAFIKLEKLKFARKLNHFALKAKIYWAAYKAHGLNWGK